jgi:hypothetical protein
LSVPLFIDFYFFAEAKIMRYAGIAKERRKLIVIGENEPHRYIDT